MEYSTLSLSKSKKRVRSGRSGARKLDHDIFPPFGSETVHGTGKSAEERYGLKKQLKNFETGTRVSQGKTKITCRR